MKKVFLFWFVFVFAFSGFAQEIIIESRAEGKNHSWYREITGNWSDSVAKSLADDCSPEEIGSRFVIIDGGPAKAQARFTPVLPKEGKYDIYVTWGRSGNAYNVKFVVNTGTEKIAKNLDQAGWGGETSPNPYEWIFLGTYDLPAGNKAYVTIDASEVTGKPSSENSGRVYSDAVKFVPSDGSAPSPAKTSSPPSQSTAPQSPPSQFAPSQPTPSQQFPASPFAPARAVPSAQPQQQKKTASVPFIPMTKTSPSPSRPSSPFVQPASTPSPFQSGPVSQSYRNRATPITPFKSSTTMSPFNPQMASVKWYTTYNQAVQAGIASGKSILLFFRSAMGRSSAKMENEILTDPQVQTRLAQSYICCKLDIAQNRQICDYYSIFKAPVLVFLDSRGYSRARIDNLLDPDQLAHEMDKYK